MTLVGRSFLHASDIHFGAPLGALEGCPQLDESTRRELIDQMQGAFDRLIDLAIAENVLFVVLAGDVYDSAEAQEGIQGRFQRGLDRLDAAGIHTYIVHGNHDPLRTGFRPRRALPDSVHIFDVDTPHEFVAAESDGERVMVSGVSFGNRAVPENLAQRFATLPIELARWRVGVLHTSLAGSSDHDPYAPCTVDDLRAAPVGYWALGHIHLRSDQNPLGPGRWWAYPGNLQGRNFKPAECHPKGAVLVRLTPDGFAAPEFKACDTVRFVSVNIAVDEIDHVADSYSLVADGLVRAADRADGRRLVVRAVLTGRHASHAEFRRLTMDSTFVDNLLDSFADEIGSTIVAGVTSAVRPQLDLVDARTGDSLLAVALRRLDAMSDDDVSSLAREVVNGGVVDVLRTSGITAAELREHTALALVEAIHTAGGDT
ncbi:MAG: exonuclease SbcCD subunit D [Ilumatobacteraceae bacterium]